MSNDFGPTPKGLESQILNLAGIILRGPTLRVPRYQRPYSWTEREVRYLIQDLYAAFLRRMPFYFVGQIVLVTNDKGELEISDGQQRMATLTMIIAYARDRLNHRKAHYQQLIMAGEDQRPLLALRSDGSGFFHGYVQEPGHIMEVSRFDDIGNDPRDRMCEAVRTIVAELDRLDREELDEFVGFICGQSTFDVMDAAERGCAATVYNRANDRGLPLSAADNMKCELLENSGLSTDEADQAAAKWEEWEDKIGRESFAKLLNQMPFLMTGEHLAAPGDLRAFRERVEAIKGGVREFLFTKLPGFAEQLEHIHNLTIDVGAASADVNRRVKMMKLFDAWDWAPAALCFLSEHYDNPEQARRFFQALERFVYACQLGVVDSRVRQKRYAAAVAYAGNEAKLYGEDALDLNDTERLRFIEQLNRSRKNDPMRRTLLIRLEAAMPGGSVLSLHDDVTVEHILPRNGGPGWNADFPDEGLRNDAANLLGNQILVTHRQNQLAGNKPFRAKRPVFFDMPDAPIHALTRDMAPFEHWTLNVIDARQERLVRILCMDWDLVRTASRLM